MDAMLPASAPKQSRTGTKIVIGCAVALGLVMLVGLALIVAGGYWLVRPGLQVPTAVVVSPQSTGRLRLENAGADPGVRELMGEFFQAARDASNEANGHVLPEWVERMQSMQAAQSGQQMEMWLPSEATLSLEPQGEEVGWVAAANFKQFVRPIAIVLGRTFKKERGVRVVVHRGREVLVFPGGTALCFADGTLLVGRPEHTLTAALDRVSPVASAAIGPSDATADLPGSWDLHGVLDRSDEARAFALVLAQRMAASSADDDQGGPAQQAAVAELESARFGLDVQTGDEVRAEAELVYATPEAAGVAERAWLDLITSARERAAAEELALSVTPEMHERVVRLRARVTGVKNALPKYAAKSMGSGRRRSGPRNER
jgi:hypothetical protein